jgi:2-iminoacetate synthase
MAAIAARSPDIRDLQALLSPTAADFLEPMAQRAEQLTRRHFGRTISLYAPLYLANYCIGGCVYCGFASDREQPRRRLEKTDLAAEIKALKSKGLDDVLLLTGERTPEADFRYLRNCVATAAKHFHNVTVESFAMTTDEYAELAHAGCTGITLYQETYDEVLYLQLHRWGPKRNFQFRLEAPERALAAGMRTVGIGALLGLADPVSETLHLYRHAQYLQKKHWQAGVTISFPRICSQLGGYQPRHEINDAFLAQMIFAFRICLPEVPLVLSTREAPAFRDGIAGVGVSRMSVASRTTVGGYRRASPATGRPTSGGPTRIASRRARARHVADTSGQFEVNDTRDVKTFCRALRKKGLEPVFKNWDSVFQEIGPADKRRPYVRRQL